MAASADSSKYDRDDLRAGSPAEPDGTRRAEVRSRGLLTERGLRIVDVVKEVAGELASAPSRVALAWVLAKSSVTAPIIGTRTLAQLEDNLGALEIELSPQQLRRLDEASVTSSAFRTSSSASPGRVGTRWATRESCL